MKKISSLLAALAATTFAATAGSIGPGPWANGAYFPGQFDGVYSATAFGSNAISGVISFGLEDGSPTVVTNSTVSTNAIQNTISVNPFQNYFVMFVNGVTYAGVTIGNINSDADMVSGALFNGGGPGTNQTASGGFTAKLKSKKAVVTFKGSDTGILTTATNNVNDSTNTFSVNGIKVSNDTASSSTATTTQ